MSASLSSALRFTLAQINPTVGDLSGNLAKIIQHCRIARDEHASDVVIFPELALCGYPPEDLLLRDDFLQQCECCLHELAAAADGITVIIGHPLREGDAVFNAMSVLAGGEARAQYRKQHLPNYAVFDEKRYFTAGREATTVDLNGIRIGLTVCEDLWRRGPVEQAVALGVDLLISINASPFHNQQAFLREAGVVVKKARQFRLPIIYLNQVGGQDELVFDGCSVVVQATGEIAARLPAFAQASRAVVFKHGRFVAAAIDALPRGSELIYRAIVLGVRDYIEKNRFKGVLLGLSGGIDSALSLAIATDAIGAQRVMAIMMPSRHTSDMSLEDAGAQATMLGARYEIISIEPMYLATMAQLGPLFAGMPAGVAEENIQARCRGMLLMAASNKCGYMVLTTSNKSELAVGYATLYGDMVGGFSALKDVPKMMVYQLAEYRNSVSCVIPARVLSRAPSAELADAQTDQDSLPPYEILDAILEAFVQHDRSAAQIIQAGFDPDIVRQVIKLVATCEYKRRQATPGVRVTSRAFGKDRRYPITSRFFSNLDGSMRHKDIGHLGDNTSDQILEL